MSWTQSTAGRTSRRDFLKQTLAGGVSLAGMPLLGRAGALDSQSSPDKRTNVLFLAVDDLRPQLGCYGHSFMKSPNIDALARRGMLFKRAYCQVPVCGASRASVLTGLRPTADRFTSYKTWAQRDAKGALSLPGCFQSAGYETICHGKIFHHSRDCQNDWDKLERHNGFPGYALAESRQQARQYNKEHNARKWGFPTECADLPDDRYPDGQVADAAIGDLRRLARQDKPFFLAAGFTKPHLPFAAPKKYWDLYGREKIDLADNPFAPKNAPREALHNWGELRGGYLGIPKRGPLSQDQARLLVHGYYACVSFVDAQIGRLIKELGRLELAENTIIVLWGDHGWNLGEHGLWCKHCNFETSLHSPLIFSGPGVRAGQTTDALVEYVDLYPSLCGMTGLAGPEHLEGTSLQPLLSNPGKPWKPAVFSRYQDGDSVKTDRYRYTRFAEKGNQTARMLYDHKQDPAENVNVAGDPAYADALARMEKWLEDGYHSALPAS